MPVDCQLPLKLVPVLKWAGGKRQLLPHLVRHIPKQYSLYCEPFLGGGALLFRLQPGKALVNDINPELMNAYQVIRENLDALLKDLRTHRNEKEYFYAVRNRDRKPGYSRSSAVKRASRIIFLNKTCYNGLFRVNRRGEFNVPFGSYKSPAIVNEENLRRVHQYLTRSKVELQCCDFLELEARIPKGAFVYVDPPYHPRSSTSSFTSYAHGGFLEEDQVRLRDFCARLLRNKKCHLLISNSYTSVIRKLYAPPVFSIKRINAIRSINSVGTKRGSIPEALITGRNRK